MKNTSAPLHVHAVNATIIRDVTPTGKAKYIVKLNDDAGTAIDRVQRCHDYRLQLLGPKTERLDEQAVFKDRSAYISFCTLPRSNNSVFLITCKCEHEELDQNEALAHVELGINKAIKQVQKLTNKVSGD